MQAYLHRGFTLIELIVTISVLAILATLAAPSMEAIINGNRLRASANETVATLQAARLQAIRANRRMVACMSPDPNADVPDCSAAGATGWVVFQDADHNGAYGAGERLVRRASLSGKVQMLASAALTHKVTFNADGMARDAGGSLLNATVSVCLPTANPQENTRAISIRAGSRLRIRQLDTGAACVTPEDKS